MMYKIKMIELISEFKVRISFHDGFASDIDLRRFIRKGFSAELLDQDTFNKVFIEDGGGLAWPNGYDICPNHLRQEMEAELKMV